MSLWSGFKPKKGLVELVMARRYSEEEVKGKLIRAVYHFAATEGIEKVTMRKVAEGCGLSTPYIYQCYRDMPALMEDAYLRADMQVANLMHIVRNFHVSEVNSRKEMKDASWQIWSLYWDFLMDDPDRAIFCWRFYLSGYFGERIMEFRRRYYKDLTEFVSRMGKLCGVASGVKLHALVSNIIDETASTAVKMHLGYIDKDALTPRMIFQSAFSLIFHLMGVDIWSEQDAEASEQATAQRQDRDSKGEF